jgi:glyoxylase-like metal-dependent hydrolase (beta-lactamase superfamily II)
MTKKMKMKTYAITPTLTLIDTQPPIPGQTTRFLGTYLIRSEKTTIVDIGPKAALPNLLAALPQLGVHAEDINYIVLTHIHIDHAGGTGTALQAIRNAQVLAHSRARPHLIDPSALWEGSLKTLGELAIKYGAIEPVPEEKIISVTDTMELDLGRSLVLEIYLTPGHAAHHLSIFERASDVLIAGEAAGVCIDGMVRPATPPPFKLEDTLSSIDKLIRLQPQKICYGHFGCYDNGLARLKRYREQMLHWYEIVTSAVGEGKSQDEIFTILRENDNELRYLDGLDKDQYESEYGFISNSIKGLAGSALVSG